MKNDATNAQMQSIKIANLLGIARGAGKLTTGFDAVLHIAWSAKILDVFVANDLSENTLKKLQLNIEKAQTNILIHKLPLDMNTLSKALGFKRPVGVLALNDKGFTKSVVKLIENGREERHDA